MKLISEHLGQIIAALAAVALLITSIVCFKAPVGDFFDNIVEKETNIGNKIVANLDNVDLTNLNADGGEDAVIDHNGAKVPKGATYYVANSDTTLNPGAPMPENEEGNIYTYSDYKYTYNPYQSAWAVKVVDNTKTSYGEILESINGKPVTILNGTFQNCRALTTAPTIPDGVKNMNNAFSGCRALTTAPTIPNGVTNIDGAFAYCSVLSGYVGNETANGDFSGYVIPETVNAMDGTFEGCTKLVIAPTIPDAVTSLESTFTDCSSLTTVTIPENVSFLRSTFENCTSLVTPPQLPAYVGNLSYTFSGCTNLTGTIEIEGVQDEYRGCFDGTEKEIILIGSSPYLEEIAATSTNGNVIYE